MPMDAIEEARRWAVATLRDVAIRIDAAPRRRVADTLPHVAGLINDVARHAALVLPHRPRWRARLFARLRALGTVVAAQRPRPD